MIGTVVSHYLVLEELGRGGMGIVYKAEDMRLRRFVALKFLPPELAVDPRVLERFQREALAASALDHPNICTIYDIDEHERRPFIVMQLLEGQTLRERMNVQPLQVEEIVEFGIQIADALDRAHAKSIVHRDIKPGNIFITTDNKAKILDFGLAKFRAVPGVDSGKDVDSSRTVQANLTTTGLIVGTISYMSPEQALGKELDPRCDLFSLGVVLYEMATSKLPFEGKTLAAIFDDILHQTPRNPSDINPALPDALVRVIVKALEKAPEKRFQTAAALRAELLLVRDSPNAPRIGASSIRQSTSLSPQHPERIGKYTVEEYLGGGMSHVYRAKDPTLGKTVAVKILTADAASDPESRSRFLREARMAANIEHPNIITVYDFGEDAGRPYIVMEFLKGDDLRTVIKENRTGDVANKLRTAAQIARALEYVHEQRIIHRDIKPENIHINPSGVVKMMDFGIAKTEDLNITRPGFTMGTPYYMAPEQILGKEVTHLVDVYAYGILLFELFTGSRPIKGENVEQIFFRILQEPIDPKPLHEASVPPSIITLITSCIAKNAGERPQSFSAIRATVEQELEMNEGRAKPKATVVVATPPTRSKAVFAGLLLILLVSTAVGLFLYWRFATHVPTVEAPVKPPPVLQTAAGEMVLVPEGEFLSGAAKQRETLPAFYINRTEITNEAYGRFSAETRRPPPSGFETAPPDYPVVNITIDDARQFARWAGLRLPTQKEWEKAARGTDGRDYPWGTGANTSLANVARQSLASVNAFPEGESPWGARQMVGNAWELIDELSAPSSQAIQIFKDLLNPPPTASESWYLMMGGSYEEPLLPGATFDTAFVPARFRAPRIGFRCVKDISAGK